jgi:hypothetical protein
MVGCIVADNRVVAAEIHGGVHPSPAVILQVLKAFDNPEGAIFSADGSHVFVSNAAEAGDLSEDFGWVEGAGYISKLDVKANGELAMVEKKLIDGLTGPLGMGVRQWLQRSSRPVRSFCAPARHRSSIATVRLSRIQPACAVSF